MKKQYINPETTMVVVNTESLLITWSTESTGSSVLSDTEASTHDGGYIGYSRHTSVWDDDEDTDF